MFGRLVFFVAGAAVGMFASGNVRGAAKGIVGAGLKLKSALTSLAAEAMEDLEDEKAAGGDKPSRTK
jgi:hypothetical protein